ncbi:MAG: hypothetical protein E7268_02325 [Lachnospiraceae bacterium]|nr:hypothetical protein [Lachnospiraceae bacterium]
MKNYTALIIDLKGSKKYQVKMRNEIQEYIMRVVENMNIIFRESMEREVEFSAGDEIQGLFSSVKSAYLYFRMFSMLVSPIEIRAGIGVGAWDVVVKDAGTTAQDGRAYHNARRAIEAVEEAKGYSVLMCSENSSDMVVNSLLNSTALIINKQSDYQNEVMLLSELLYPINLDGIVNAFKLREIFELLRFKNDFLRYEYTFSKPGFGRGKRESVFCKLNYYDIEIECKPINIMVDSTSFFIEEGRVRGLALQLSRLLGVSRQSVEKTIKSGLIYESRNLAITTLIYLEELEG